VGLQKNIGHGLRWVRSAAKWGSLRARAAFGRLHRAYGFSCLDQGLGENWLSSKTARADFLFHLMQPDEIPSRRPFELFPPVEQITAQQWIDRYESLFSWRDPDRLATELTAFVARQEHTASFYTQALRYACTKDCPLPVVVMLLDAYYATIPEQQRSRSPRIDYFISALCCGRADVVRMVVSRFGTGLRGKLRRNHDGVNPLLFVDAMPESEMKDVVRSLVDLGFDANEPTPAHLLRGEYPCPEVARSGVFEPWALLELEGRSVTPLRWAILKNNAAMFQALLACGPEFPLVPGVDGYAATKLRRYRSSMCTAVVLDEPCCNLEILRMFFAKRKQQQHESMQTSAPFAETPLGLLTMDPDSPARRLRFGEQSLPANLFPVLDLLRSHQPDSDAQLFWAAAMNNHVDVVRYLIAAGVDIDLRFKGMTPLQTSILYGRDEIFKLLLENGANAEELTSEKGISTMHLVFWKPKLFEAERFMMTELLRRRVDVSRQRGEFGKHVHPLHLAVLGGRHEAVKLLLQHGADRSATLGQDIMTTVRGNYQFTHWGIRREAVRKQVAHEPSIPSERNEVLTLMGCTPLGVLLTRIDMFELEDAVKMLWILVGGEDNPAQSESDLPRYYTRRGLRQTVLHLLVCIPPLALMEWSPGECLLAAVLRHGARAGLHLNICDVHGDTPLHYACVVRGNEDIQVASTLAKFGADKDLQNVHGLSPATAGVARYWAHTILSGRSDVEEAAPEEFLLLEAWLQEDKPSPLSPLAGRGSPSGANNVEAASSPPPELGAQFLDDRASPDTDTRDWLYGALGSPSGNSLGRLWEKLCVRTEADEVWDFEKKKWVALPMSVRVRTSTLSGRYHPSKDMYSADLVIQGQNRG
jgi:ankyrin repeat protein